MKSASFAALATNVFSTLHSQSLSRTVDFWDETALDLTAGRFPFSGKKLSEAEAETLRATASIAVYDAIDAVLHEGVSIFYQSRSLATTAIGAEAAASQAAYEVLATYFSNPLDQAELRSRLARRLAAVADGHEKREGVATGRASAQVALSASHLDLGSTRRAA
ncbi:MAG: hypothetical protein QM680_12610 [Luteolibacter sp.]